MAPMYTQVDSGRVFKCWFEHPADMTSSYAYAVLPCRDAAATKAFAKAYASGKTFVKASTGICGKSSKAVLPQVLRNDDSCQALSYRGEIYVIVHKAGTYSFDGGRHIFSNPGIYFCTGGGVVSEPLPSAAGQD